MGKKTRVQRKAGLVGVATATVLALLLTIGAAVVQGRLAGRWGATDVMLQAAKRLNAMPKETLGSWQLEQSRELSPSVVEILECRGHINRTYVNRSTGDVVNVAVILGPAGPVAIHTPEICYSSQQYSQTSQRQRDEVSEDDALWSLTFQSNDVDAESFVVYYGWSDGSRWQATDDPRWEFAGQPYLYKLQIAGRSNELQADADHAACRKFLKEFLPLLDKYILPRGSQPVQHQG